MIQFACHHSWSWNTWRWNPHFSVPHYLALWLVLGPNILVLCFILHVLSKLRGRKKKKKKRKFWPYWKSRFWGQKELKKWLRNEVLEQHEAEASQVVSWNKPDQEQRDQGLRGTCINSFIYQSVKMADTIPSARKKPW